jgi:hypothetical protein
METKPALKTSEFWMVLAMHAFAVLAYLGGTLPPKYGMPLQALLTMAYTLSRGIAKAGVAPDGQERP